MKGRIHTKGNRYRKHPNKPHIWRSDRTFERVTKYCILCGKVKSDFKIDEAHD